MRWAATLALAALVFVGCAAPGVGEDSKGRASSVKDRESADKYDLDTPDSKLGKLEAPLAFPGGDSIAIRWTPIPGITRYDVLRDDKQLATVEPGFHSDFPEKDGAGFIDYEIAANETHTYKIQAIKGEESTTSPAVTVRQLAAPIPTITLDSSKAPDLDGWLTDTVEPFVRIWWPKMFLLLVGSGYQPTQQITFFVDPDYDGLAEASIGENRVRIRASYARENPHDLGMVLHESVHILEGYVKPVPGWITEGVADWSREYILHDRAPEPIRPSQTYTAGYSQGSFFIQWMADLKDDATFVRRLNVAAHEGTAEAFIQKMTGKSIAQLDEQYKEESYSTPFKLKRNGECLDAQAGGYAPCDGSGAQSWTLVRGQMIVGEGDKCIDTKPSIGTCGRERDLKWTKRSDGKLIGGKGIVLELTP